MQTASVAKKPDKLSEYEDDILLRKLQGYVDRWRVGEDERRAFDRKGARFYKDDMWTGAIVSSASDLQITANVGRELYERVVAMVTNSEPEPEVIPVDPDDDEAARINEGALRTVWRRQRMQDLLRRGSLLCGFTRPIGWYAHFNRMDHGGIGDINTRIIPAHRLIVDDRFARVKDMKYKGFSERTSRAELMQLFPDKAEEIEAAAFSTGGDGSPIRSNDRDSGAAPRTVDRLVSQSVGGSYAPVSSVRAKGGSTNADPIAETVDVVFLWIDDPSPMWEIKPLHNDAGKPLWEFVKDDSDDIVFDHEGVEVVDGPYGPIYMPIAVPRMKPRTERVLTRKYKHLRHVAWIPQDRLKLWDVRWDGPAPIAIQRDTYALDGFHSRGSALGLTSLGVAYNILLTIIFKRLRLSLGGTWLATPGSGLKKNKLIPEPGVVFTVNNLDQVKDFPMTPLDAAYFNLLDKIENMMQGLLGLSAPMLGNAAGRADSPQTYETLSAMGGVRVGSRAAMVAETVRDWAEIALWLIQNRFTHEHIVEVENEDGSTDFKAASILSTRGEFSVHVDVGTMLAHDPAADRAEAKEAAALGFYALPMLGRIGRVKHWKAALKQRAAIMAKGPQWSWLLGASAAPASAPQALIRSQGRRSHHAKYPGAK